MSVFPGANNTTINNGTFNAVSTTVSNIGAPNDIISILHSHSATAGLLDAKERFDAPKCDEGTRTSMILGMKKFVQEGNAASSPGLYWLHGPAGVGKSALAQSLSLSLKDEGDHAASFFFSRTSPGRNNGNQLVMTLAYQLAKNIPALQPFISKVVNRNPDILTASNSAQMKGLIVDPINKWHKKYKRSIRRWTDRVTNAKPHPRLILVDGLDECSDPNVQTDLILCIASAVRQLSAPFRFVVVSRPEFHIIATFELNSAFQGRDGMVVTKKNLGDDEDADEQITTFLVKEFSEIRRTHPIRDFLPPQWPGPNQIGQLVAKSSKGFIYPTTVIRYIKMLHNRPDECLDRILGLSEIPAFDKPYEPLDCLYRYIFESVPEANKASVHSLFHLLVVPSTWDDVTNPRIIERHFGYTRGHVHHILSRLLCVAEVNRKGRIEILHASLPDFLLDKSRSGPLCIDVGNAHATIAACYLSNISLMHELPSTKIGFPAFLSHMMQANMLGTPLLHKLLQINLFQCYTRIHTIWVTADQDKDKDGQIEGIAFMMAYFLVLVIRHVPENYIRGQILAIKAYILESYPATGDTREVNERMIPYMTLCFRDWTSRIYHKSIKHIFACEVGPSQTELREAIFELHFLMMAYFYRNGIELSSSRYSDTKGHLTTRLEQRMTRGPYFWANIVKGIDNSSNITPTKPIYSMSDRPDELAGPSRVPGANLGH